MVVLDEDTYVFVRAKLVNLAGSFSDIAACMNRAAIDCVDNTGDENVKSASQILSDTAANINYQAGRINDIITELDREFDEVSQSRIELV